MPNVAAVTVRAADDQRQRVIHILDWHYLPENRFRLDTPDGDYYKFLDEVEALQAQQRALIRAMGVKAVFLEGLTPANPAHYRERVATLKRYKPVPGDDPISAFVVDSGGKTAPARRARADAHCWRVVRRPSGR
jgi:hypothetical protein